MHVREAHPREYPVVMGILDAAMLKTDPEAVRERMPEGVLVAGENGRVFGVLVLADSEIVAVAVRPGRRGQGIGSALVAAAADRRDRLIAHFDADLQQFYERLGFDVKTGSEGRCLGVFRP